MGANVLRSAAHMPRQNSISKLINHYNNNNLQTMRSFSYKFDPPTSSNNKVTLLGVGLAGITAGILIGGFGIHVDVSPVDNSLGISVGPPRPSNQLYLMHLAASKQILDEMIDSGLFLSLAAQNSQAQEIAAERYLVGIANYFNIQCLNDPNSSYVNKLKELKRALSQLKRVVHVKRDTDEKGELYEFLKYDDDGMSCVVKGPLHLGQGLNGLNNYLSEDSSHEGAEIITVKRNDVYFNNKTPVECHDLDGKNSHCNGKIGTVVGTKGDDVLVSFEDPALRAECIPRGNLRVVNKLPLIREDVPFPLVPPNTPVICQGLKFDYEKHLNDKRGTVLSVDENNNSAIVAFEDPNLPDTKVHLKNLFLSRELPKRFMPSIPKSKDK